MTPQDLERLTGELSNAVTRMHKEARGSTPSYGRTSVLDIDYSEVEPEIYDPKLDIRPNVNRWNQRNLIQRLQTPKDPHQIEVVQIWPPGVADLELKSLAIRLPDRPNRGLLQGAWQIGGETWNLETI